jgi:hypothetical protein
MLAPFQLLERLLSLSSGFTFSSSASSSIAMAGFAGLNAAVPWLLSSRWFPAPATDANLYFVVVVDVSRANVAAQNFKSLSDRACHVRARRRSRRRRRRSARRMNHFDKRSGVESSLGIFSSRMRTPAAWRRPAGVRSRSSPPRSFFSLKLSLGDAQMLDQKTKRNLLGDFESALDFVHGLDSARRGRWTRC